MSDIEQPKGSMSLVTELSGFMRVAPEQAKAWLGGERLIALEGMIDFRDGSRSSSVLPEDGAPVSFEFRIGIEARDHLLRQQGQKE